MPKVWKLILEAEEKGYRRYRTVLVEVEREYCPVCKVVIIEGACFCEWK